MMGAAALLMGASFTSCSKDKDLYDPQANAMKFLQDYQAAFISVFGQPDINQTWGFGDPAATSRMTRGVNTNANQWAAPEHGGWLVPDTLTDAQKLRVKAYFQAHKNLTYQDPQWTNFFVQHVYKGGTDPTGTLSTEHYTDAQNHDVVGGNQMDYLTFGSENGTYVDHTNNFNGANAGYTNVLDNGQPLNNGTMHKDRIMLMTDSKTNCVGFHDSYGQVYHIDGHCALVSAAVIDKWAVDSANSIGAAVVDKWKRSFVGLDYEGKTDGAYDLDYSNWPAVSYSYVKLQDMVDGNSQYVLVNGQMKAMSEIDLTQFLFNERGDTVRYLSDQANQFLGHEVLHAGKDKLNSKLTKDQFSSLYGIEITNSEAGYFNLDSLYALVNKHNALPTKNNKDFIANIGGRDYVYSDWIVTLSEATKNNGSDPQPETKSIRIMAEDVAAAAGSDIDFNDVVFDVEATFAAGAESTNKVTITVRAAGGTMPLYIGGVEVHEKMLPGVANNTKTMINTDANFWADGENYFAQDGVAPVSFDLNVTVGKASFLSDVNTNVVVTVNNQGNIVPVLAEKGEPAAKIAVPVGTPWVREKINIGLAYSLFTDWVQNNSNSTNWYADPDRSKVME